MAESTPTRPVRGIANEWIPLADGARLAARLWLPESAEREPVPAVLEYIPYRKDDGTAADDAARHPYFASRGYACVRVDLRGSGDSDGVLEDEYSATEHADALEVLSWIAAQPWCTGRVGMVGYSWGGFNALQVAALRPPELGAIVTLCSTDDRYADDCHYMGGCLLASDMLKWASWMLAFQARPPDPLFVGERWRGMWLERLRDTPPYIEAWLSHQRRDAYWRHGSVCEDYGAIAVPVLAAGGWADAYTNAIPRLLERLSVPRRGVIGPWGHMFPHLGVPGPAIGFLDECVRWWDRWLKSVPNGAESGPLLRAWMQGWTPPAGFLAERPGRWIAEESWPPPTRALELPIEGGTLIGTQTCGATAGVWCANGMPDELAEDQRPDDALSLVTDSEPLAERTEVLGSPVARLALSVDRPLALVAVRLCDVAPSGESLLVSWGMLNLTHRGGHETPEPMEPGRRYRVAVRLNTVAHTYQPGHRIRVAVSPTYWPHAWPSPEPVTLTLEGGTLTLPVREPRSEDAAVAFGPPEPSDTPGIAEECSRSRTRAPGVIEDRQTYRVRIETTGTDYRHSGTDRWSIAEDDPLSAQVHCEREVVCEREGWRWSIRTTSDMSCDATVFRVDNTVEAYEEGRSVFARTTRSLVPRDLV